MTVKRLMTFWLLLLAADFVLSAGITLTQIPNSLYRENSAIVIRWQEPIEARLKFGLTSGNYTFQSRASGNRQLTIIPQNEGMAPGVYYCIVSSSSLSSREFKIIVESSTAPNMVSPANNSTIATAIPEFSWDAVPGVPFYHLILSDQPVTIQEDANGELQLDGGNIIWQIITPYTRATYGEKDPSGFFAGVNKNHPPVLEGAEYNWVVLNNYNNHPAFSSIVQAGVSGFRVRLNTGLATPALQSPQNKITITSADITFRWGAVSGATSYQLVLSETIEQDGSTSSFVLWSPVTRDNFIDLPARQMLKGGQYFWRVIALGPTGQGSGSEVRSFTYAVPQGTLVIQSRDNRNAALPRVEIRIAPLNGTGEISNLLTADNGVLTQSAQPGEYRIYGHKEGFADTSIAATVRAGETQSVNLILRELLQSVTGKVTDNSSQAIPGATVHLESISGERLKSQTDPQGGFRLFVSAGSWTAWAEKEGYQPSAPAGLVLHPNSQKSISLVLKRAPAQLSGLVKSSEGLTVSGARVTAENGAQLLETVTNNSGRFELLLHAGSWTVSAFKTGYTPSGRRTITLSSGQAISLSPDLVIRSDAALVSGMATTPNRPAGGVQIEAVPKKGDVQVTTTDPKGNFQLSLGEGLYQIRALSRDFIPAENLYVDLAKSQTLSGLTIGMSEPFGFISGRVLLGNQAVEGAIVSNGTSYDTTRADGYYRLPAQSGPHTLTATAKGLYSSGDKPVDVQRTEVANIDLTMKQGGTIEGIVLSQGLGVPYAAVTARSGSQVFHYHSQIDGSYWISVPAGVWTVTVQKPGFENATFNGVAVNSGQTISGVDFSLNTSASVLRGKVTDTGGGPIQNVDVEIKESGIHAVTDRLGQYALSMSPGGYTVIAGRSGYVHQQKGVTIGAGTATVNFVLTPLALVHGQVTAAGGEALDRIRVSATGSDTVWTESDHAGEYWLYLTPGTWQVSADALGYAESKTTVNTAYGADITKNFSLASAPNEIARIQGRIVDSQGTPLVNIPVSLGGHTVRTLYSNAAGNFDTDILETGKSYRLQPFADGRFFVPKSRNYSPLTSNQGEQNFVAGRWGDVSGNEKISSFDGSLVLRLKAEQDISPYYRTLPRDSIAADVSGNNQVSPFDASLIFRYAAGLISEFPSEGNYLGKVTTADQPAGRLVLQLVSVTGNQYAFELSADMKGDLYSGELWFKVDPAMSFTKVTSSALDESRLYSNAGAGYLKIVFAAAEPLATNRPLMRLEFSGSDFANGGASVRLLRANLNEKEAKIESGADYGDQEFSAFKLYGNYPNPFNGATLIRYVLPTKPDGAGESVEIRVYNVLGQVIRQLLSTKQEPGYHEVIWDGKTDFGAEAASGVYIIRISAGPHTATKKLLLVR